MRKNKVALLGLIAVIAVSAVIFLIIGNNNKNIKEFIISGENYEDCVIEKYKNSFITYNGTELIHYDLNMEQKWVVTVNERDAKLCVNGDYILIYSSSDRIYLINDGKIIYNIKYDKDIRKIQLNENGYAAMLTEDKGFKGQCRVISNSGEILAEYSYGERYILGAYLMSDNSTLVMNVFDDVAEYGGKIVISDITNNELKKEITAEKIYDYVYVYKNKVFASDGNTLFCYDKKGNEKWQYIYENEELLSLKFSDNYLTLILKADGNAGENVIRTLNLSGRLKGSYTTEGSVELYDVSEGKAAIYVNGEVELISIKGHLKAETDAEIKTNDVLLFNGGSRVMTVSDKATIKGFNK